MKNPNAMAGFETTAMSGMPFNDSNHSPRTPTSCHKVTSNIHVYKHILTGLDQRVKCFVHGTSLGRCLRIVCLSPLWVRIPPGIFSCEAASQPAGKHRYSTQVTSCARDNALHQLKLEKSPDDLNIGGPT